MAHGPLLNSRTYGHSCCINGPVIVCRYLSCTIHCTRATFGLSNDAEHSLIQYMSIPPLPMLPQPTTESDRRKDASIA
ncbi:hypothetical protein VTO73DRAFT_13657 [Trametes versicolor]